MLPAWTIYIYYAATVIAAIGAAVLVFWPEKKERRKRKAANKATLRFEIVSTATAIAVGITAGVALALLW
jgi:uncharacterized protein (DUF2062 family)